MAKEFKTALAFRTSLEERLKQHAGSENVPLAPLRLKVAIERFLARIFSVSNPPWLLKGGYAMELRYRPRARTTKDIDLSVKTGEGELAARLERLREELQEAAEQAHERTMQAISRPGSSFCKTTRRQSSRQPQKPSKRLIGCLAGQRGSRRKRRSTLLRIG